MITAERSNLKRLIRAENTANFARSALEFAREISPELVDKTQVAINKGEGVPEAYFSYLKENDTLFIYRPLTGDLFVRMGGLDIANGMLNPDVTRWTTAGATPKSEAAILAARILLSDMVAFTQLPSGVYRPLSELEHSRIYGYPKLEEILKGIGIKGDSNKKKIEPLVSWEMGTRTLMADSNEGWALLTFSFGRRLYSIQVIDQPRLEVKRCGVGHRILKLEDETHVTDIYLDSSTDADEYNRWLFSRVWGLDAKDRKGTYYDVGLSDDGVVAIDLPLEIIHEIRKFEQPNYPWKFPELSYDR